MANTTLKINSLSYQYSLYKTQRGIGSKNTVNIFEYLSVATCIFRIVHLLQ